MTRDETIDAIAELMAGLQVPISMGMPLGAALEPWRRLNDEAVSFGWADANMYRVKLAEMLADTS